MSDYKKEDFVRISWEEYGQTLESLYQKLAIYLEENSIKVGTVVPILRGGAFPGVYLAYKLHLLNILPVQYKYLVDETISKFELKRLDKTPESAFRNLSASTILVVGNNHCFGTTSKKAIADLKQIVPDCKIIYAAACMDYSYQDMPEAEATFYGKLTNETRVLSEDDAKSKELNNNISLFPWEDIEEEWAMVQEKKFNYE